MRHNRHREHAIAVSLMDGRRQSAGLATEDEHCVTRLAKWRIPEGASAFGGEEIGLAEFRKLQLEIFPAVPEPRRDVLPIIQARSLHLAIVEGEAERLHEMELRA